MISIEKINKSFGKKQILNDISFSAEKGCCIGILGANGSGKSTLFSILAGIIDCDKGEFLYQGKNLITDEKLRSRVVGYVPQNTPLFEELTAKDNLSLWYSRAEIDKQLDNGVLSLLGINNFINLPVYKMSGGMKKRLAIGCAVANNPKILILDEPSAALDIVCKESISSYLNDYKKNGGIILLATHDIQELSLCDSLYILKDAKLETFVFDGNVSRLAGSLQ